MPRRFALGLVGLLVLLLAVLFVARRITTTAPPGPAAGRRTAAAPPTPVVPPTPIPGRRVALWFEPKEGELFRSEIREIPAAADDIAFLRALASAVLEGPRHPDLLRPFPEGWSVRGAYRLRSGLVVIDLAPPAPPVVAGADGPSAPETAPGSRWQTGSHEELAASQALLITLAKNVPEVSKVVLVVGGEPVETLAGHLDLAHPLSPDLARAGSEPALEVTAPLLEPLAPSPVPTLPEPKRDASRPRTDVA
jgi:hypothetical protein